VATAGKRSRLRPEERREQILDHAQALLAERSYDELTTVDIARAAGVTRALVHHYFGGKREIYLEIARRVAQSTMDLPRPEPGGPLRKRIAAGTTAWLDWAERNRVPFLAITGQGQASVDEAILAVDRGGREANVERLLHNNADLLPDTEATRFALRGFVALVQEVTRTFLLGGATRDEAHVVITEVFVALIRDAAPRLSRLEQSAKTI
jgi:AcrR family transcriptional regulator